MPSRWARLAVTAFVGVEEIKLVCRGEEEVHPRRPAGTKSVRYRHYLPELSRKPQAVRQVAPELLAELGEPYARLWQLLVEAHGGLEAARTLARLLAVIEGRGEEAVRDLLTRALEQATPARSEPACDLTSAHVTVPDALRVYQVEAGRASDYDWLLQGGAR